MNHLSVAELVQLREPGLEPGVAAARVHLESCAQCQAEADRLSQRVARLRALPALKPARDHWSTVRVRARQERRRRIAGWAGLAGLAAAASMVLAIQLRVHRDTNASRALVLDSVMTRSGQLERLLSSYHPEQRVLDGHTIQMAGQLEDRIALVDRQLEVAQTLDGGTRDAAMLRLWRQRVGLLDALVDVHLTRASAAGF
jgi:hypothetical protein